MHDSAKNSIIQVIQMKILSMLSHLNSYFDKNQSIQAFSDNSQFKKKIIQS